MLETRPKLKIKTQGSEETSVADYRYEEKNRRVTFFFLKKKWIARLYDEDGEVHERLFFTIRERDNMIHWVTGG